MSKTITYRNLVFDAGSDYSDTVTFYEDASGNEEKDLSDYEATTVIKEYEGGPALLTLTSNPSSGVTLGGSNGTITHTLTDSQVEALGIKSGYYFTDLLNTNTDLVDGFLQGRITILTR